MCRMGRWSFWSWFDVNPPTFNEGVRKKRFSHFRPHWPRPMTFRPQICSPSYSYPVLNVSTKFEFSTALLFRENRSTGRTDRQTDGRGETLNASLYNSLAPVGIIAVTWHKQSRRPVCSITRRRRSITLIDLFIEGDDNSLNVVYFVTMYIVPIKRKIND